MGLKKKIFAVILAAALTVGFCGSALAAWRADPTFTSSNGFTYSNGTKDSTSGDYKLLMINGSLVPAPEIETVDGITYLPLVQIATAYQVPYVEDANGAFMVFDGVEIALSTNDSVFRMGEDYYELGQPVLYMNGKIYFPILWSKFETVYGNLTVSNATPYGFPLVSIDMPLDGGYKYSSSTFALAGAAHFFGMTYEDYLAIYRGAAWFQEVGPQGFSDFKEEMLAIVENMPFVGMLSHYYYFEDDFGLLVDRYTGDIYVCNGDSVKYINDANLADLLK